MADLDYFIGNWNVDKQEVRSHPVQEGQSFTIRREGDDRVSFEFHEPFGDGCWNHHIRNGRMENGHIRADIVDDGVCKPAPNTDTLLIEEDRVRSEPGMKRIHIRVFTQQSLEEPGFRNVEEGGEFGAEDGGG
jgi:hypothetical protein